LEQQADHSPGSEETGKMYTGKMIEELIGRVERAEAHAAVTQDQASPLLPPVPVELVATRRHDFTHDYEELLGVA
jgi:hypothetical protein